MLLILLHVTLSLSANVGCLSHIHYCFINSLTEPSQFKNLWLIKLFFFLPNLPNAKFPDKWLETLKGIRIKHLLKNKIKNYLT